MTNDAAVNINIPLSWSTYMGYLYIFSLYQILTYDFLKRLSCDVAGKFYS